ncbi:MAG: hypothetical protein BGO55_06200 [Sphingobacteriales bacterium 50-39]|nr:MAG: hypothetical protein BGO55_06200 [Sphingobacteriales bacterium 50-39]
MYFIRKYADCWAVHNDDTGESRKLTEEEIHAVQEEFPALSDEQVRSIFSDNIHCLHLSPPQPRQHKSKKRRIR